MKKEYRYPKYDIGDFLPSPSEDWYWGEGTLTDGRPYRAEMYYQAGVTCVTLYMSALDIERYSAIQLKELLVSEGVVAYDDDLYHSSGFDGDNLEAKLKEDAAGNMMWNLQIIIGDEDGTYVTTHFKLGRYHFFDLLNEAPMSEDYLLAIGEEPERTIHPCILVNTTPYSLDVVIERPPVLKILQGAGVPELVATIRTGRTASIVHGPVLARGSVSLSWGYYDWEFDFPNKKYVFVKTYHKELLLGFFMQKYFNWAKEQQIPFTERQGWICPAKIILDRVVSGVAASPV